MGICYSLLFVFKTFSKQNITHKPAHSQKRSFIGRGRKEEQVDEKKHVRKVRGKSRACTPPRYP